MELPTTILRVTNSNSFYVASLDHDHDIQPKNAKLDSQNGSLNYPKLYQVRFLGKNAGPEKDFLPLVKINRDRFLLGISKNKQFHF
jgi:hypothetical protein